MIIEDKDICLRNMIEDDLDDYVNWYINETEWQNWNAPWEYENYQFIEEEFRKKKIKEINETKDCQDSLEIVYKNIHVGSVSHYFIDDDMNISETNQKNIAIGIVIYPMDFRGKHIDEKALNMYIDYLKELGYQYIYTQTWSGNIPMISLAKKIGFQEYKRNKNMRTVKKEKFDRVTLRLE